MKQILLLLPLLLLAAEVRAVEIQARAWRMTPSGSASSGADGSKIDLEKDLGYSDAESVAGLDFVAGATHQVAISYLNFDISARNHVDRDFTFGDQTFHADTDVDSSLKATMLRGSYRYETGSDAFHGGFLLGIQSADVDAQVSAENVGRVSETSQFALPAIGGFGGWQITELFSVQAAVTGGAWQWQNIEAGFFDFEASARFDLGNFFAGAGYRRITIDGKDDDEPAEIDIEFSGPTAFAGVNF